MCSRNILRFIYNRKAYPSGRGNLCAYMTLRRLTMPTGHLRSLAPIFGACLLAATLQAAQAGTSDGRVPFGAGAAVLHYPRYHAYRLEHVKIRIVLDEAHRSLT